MDYVWKIIWFTLALQHFTCGCQMDELRKNKQILFGINVQDIETVKPNSVLPVKCFNDDKITSAKIKCSKLDEWELPPACGKLCPPFTASKEIKVEYSPADSKSHAAGVKAMFSCVGVGLFLSGDDTVTCTSSGAWSGTVPQCVDYMEVFATPGEDVTLTCRTSATADQCQLVTWLYEDEVIATQSENFQQVTTYKNSLTISKLNEISAGRYGCACINLETTAAAIMTFDVNLVTDKPHHSLLLTILQQKSNAQKKNAEKQAKRNRKVKLKYRSTPKILN